MEDFNSKYTGEEVENILDSVGSKQDAISDLDNIRSGADKGATAVQPETLSDYALEGYVDNEVKALGDSLAKVASSGSYNDLQDKPTIPSAINIAGTNYTPADSGIIDLNQAGLYRKPSVGIPKEDLSSEVQTSLRNAEAYKGTVTGVKINGTTKSPSNGVIDLGNIPTSIPTEVYIADFTMESLKTGMNNGSQVGCDMQSLITALSANKVILVRESEISDYKGVYVLNGFAEDLLYFSIVDSQGNILYCDGTNYTDTYIDGQTLRLQDWLKKQDTLVSGENIKTINGTSILGSGDITISGGSGEQGPQGEKGDKGDKGDTGVGVQSVKQTTISNADGGSNVVTVTLTNGTTSTFTVKNGSKGSQGIQGEQGPKGETGATGADGAKGDKGDKGDTGPAGANGTNGVSVSSVKQTTTSTADGGTNVVTVTLSNGTTSTFNVKNGSKGSSGSNGTNGKDGADGATFTPSVDSAGNLSWTNNKGLANPPTVNIKGPKGDAGEGGGSTGGGTIETIEEYGGNGDPLVIDEMLAEKRYYLFIGNSGGGEETIEIDSFEGNDASDVMTIKHFYAVINAEGTGFGSMPPNPFNITLILPDVDIKWANNLVPTIVGSGLFELSITQINDYGIVYYNAVLTPFKPVE